MHSRPSSCSGKWWKTKMCFSKMNKPLAGLCNPDTEGPGALCRLKMSPCWGTWILQAPWAARGRRERSSRKGNFSVLKWSCSSKLLFLSVVWIEALKKSAWESVNVATDACLDSRKPGLQQGWIKGRVAVGAVTESVGTAVCLDPCLWILLNHLKPDPVLPATPQPPSMTSRTGAWLRRSDRRWEVWTEPSVYAKW